MKIERKKYIYWIISLCLIGITIGSILLAVMNKMPPFLVLEIAFLNLILFIANVASGITFGILQKNKLLYIGIFATFNIVCIVSLIYFIVLSALILL